MGQSRANAKNLNDVNSWKSTSITQFELSKVIYTSGFLQKCNLTATAKLVLMALIQHYNANNPDMFPSQKFLAQQLGISEKSVERAILNLKDEDYIYYVTHRVNRYRFTAHFFESVKMSVANRQNVGCGVRQNVGETNKKEKRKEKEDFLIFSFGTDAKICNNRVNGANAPQTSDADNGFEQALKNDLRKLKEKESDFSAAGGFSQTSNVTEFSRMSKEADTAAFVKSGTSEKALGKRVKSFKQAKSASENCYEQDAQKSTWPIDWNREDALRWVQSLAPVFRDRGMAKLICEKYNYSYEEVWGTPKEPHTAKIQAM